VAGPRVSVGMPVWNGEEFIRSGIGSLLRQTFGDLELIISDNASTDTTQEICEEYAASDPRVRYHRNTQNIGLQANFEKVLSLATAPYFMWGCPDDLWDSSYVAKMVEVLDSCPAVVLSGSNSANIDRDGVPLSHFDNASVYAPRQTGARAHRFICAAPGGGQATLIYGLMRTPVIQRVGLVSPRSTLDHHRGYYATDLLTLFSLMFEGDFHVVDETLYFHRDTHFDRRGFQRIREVIRAWKRVHGYYGDLRTILQASPLDARQESMLVRTTLRKELEFYPAYTRRLMASQVTFGERGART
jgi:glycosyltransferase involved in cell wall biosynthesis